MPLNRYSILKGVVAGHTRDADDDHYQLLVHAGKTPHRIAVNVRSSAKNAPSTVLFAKKTALPDAFVDALRALPSGVRKVPSKPGGLALDYLRDGKVDFARMKPVPPDVAGEDNDLKDEVEAAALAAMADPGSFVCAFGASWGPEDDVPDKYFHFAPGRGIHDIHMNQGNEGRFAKDNGAYQDGGLVFAFSDGRVRAYFFAFQSQRVPTDDRGYPAGDAPPATAYADGEPSGRARPSKPKKPKKPKAAKPGAKAPPKPPKTPKPKKRRRSKRARTTEVG